MFFNVSWLIDQYLNISLSILIVISCFLFLIYIYLIQHNNLIQNKLLFNILLSITLSATLIIFFHTLLLFLSFDNTKLPYQLITELKLFSTFSWTLALDNLSLLFLLLLTFLIPITILLNVLHDKQLSGQLLEKYLNKIYNSKLINSKNYTINNLDNRKLIISLFLFIFLEFILFNFFTVTDYFFFYIFFELSMIPLYFFIGIFGSRVNKIKASYYIYFYTVLGSIPFLIGLILLLKIVGSTNLFYLLNNYEKYMEWDIFLWPLFFIPLAVKVPMVPLHLWLPEAHVEAPTEGSVILAGLLLKLGGYGLLRFLLPLFPQGTVFFTPIVIVISLIGLLYISLLIFNQIDFKKIIAYSSITHMNFALLGLFSGTIQGIQGSIFLMFTHGIISSGLFILIGSLYGRYHSKLLFYYQGIINQHPILSFFFFILTLGNLGFPGTGGFIGEFLITLGIFNKSFVIGLLSLLGPFFCTLYSFLLFTRTMFGLSHINTYYIDNKNLINNLSILTISKLEYYILLFFVVLTIITGIFSSFLISFTELYTYSISLYYFF